MNTALGEWELRNPVIAAAGTFGYAEEFDEVTPATRLGGLVTKGISLDPRPGNPAPRVFDTASGMLNSIGLENVGCDRFIQDKLPYLRRLDTKVIVNFFGETPERYVEVARKLSEAGGIGALEMNISCPNTKKGGLEYGTDPDTARAMVRACRDVVSQKLWVKLTPNVTSIVPLAKACVDAGADVLSVANTVRGMGIDPVTRQPRLSSVIGGLSGPAIKPIALRLVYEVAQAGLGVPICGIGGVASGRDVVEFLIAGASAVQVGTQSFVDPRAPIRIASEFQRFCRKQGIDSSSELIGSLKLP